jgi:DNA polymerase theta
MSATLPNLEDLRKWLDAELFHTLFRPIPLGEFFKIDEDIYDSTFQMVRKMPKTSVLPNDRDNLAELVMEVVREKCSVLVFCSRQAVCEEVAVRFCESFVGSWMDVQWADLLLSQFLVIHAEYA